MGVYSMNYYIDKTRIIFSTIILLVVLIMSACDRSKNKIDNTDIVRIIDLRKPLTEKHAKRGIEISEEDHKKLLLTIKQKGILYEK